MFKSNYKILLWILTGLVLILLKSFILPAILGGILALILYKPIRILNLKIKNYKVSVLLTTTICGGVFFIPLVMILISGISDLIVFIKSGVIQEAFNQAPNFLQTNLPKIQASLPLPLENIQKPLTQIIQHISVKGGQVLQRFILDIPRLIMDWAIIVLTTNVFLLEKDKIREVIFKNKLFESEETKNLSNSIITATQSVVISSLFSGICQAIVMTIVASILVPDKILLVGILTFILSFVPVIGTSPLTGSLLIYNWVHGNISAMVVVIIGVGILTLIDNIIRPLMIGNKIAIHPLLAFLSALGGLSLFGFYGLFLGPIAVGILFSLLKKEL